MSDTGDFVFEKSWDISKEDWPLGPQQEENAFNEQQIIQNILAHVMDLGETEDPGVLDQLVFLGQELMRAQQPGSVSPHEDHNPDLADDDPMQDSARDYMMGDRYTAPQMMPRGGEMARIMEMLQSDPEVYQDHGDEHGGQYNQLTMDRPDMTDLYAPHEQYGEPMPEDYLGDYHGDDGSMRGHLQKLKLMDMLRGLMPKDGM